MSVRAMTAVFDHSRATFGSRLVLLALADHADDYGICWPGVDCLKDKTLMSERNVQYALRTLEELGEITTTRRAHRTNLYRIVLPGLLGANFAPSESFLEGAKSDIEGAKSDSLKVQPVAPEPSIEPPIEPSETLVEKDDDFESFWKAYPAGKGNKKAAVAQWKKLSTRQKAAAVAALPDWKSCERWQAGYVKSAYIWLRDRWFADEVPPSRNGGWRHQPEETPDPDEAEKRATFYKLTRDHWNKLREECADEHERRRLQDTYRERVKEELGVTWL